jgi:hypothetical protein
MSKLLTIAASLKAVLVAASVALARGEMPAIVVISVLFNLAAFGEKPVGLKVPRDGRAVSQSNDRGR